MSAHFLVVAAVGMMFISSMANTSVSVAFPEIQSSLDSSVVLAGWVLTTGPLAGVAISPIAGKISDTFGRKRTYLFFTALFTLGSLLSALAPNIYLLIAARLVQGAGSGAFVAAAAGVLADAFPRSRQLSIGLLTTFQTAGNIVGPTLGGWLTENFGWHSVFWFNVPWGIVALAGCYMFVKNDQARTRASIDIRGAALFAASLSVFMVGITLLGGSASGMTWAVVAGLVALSFALAIVFARHESRTKDPIIDIEIFRGRPFLATNIYNFIYGLSVGVLTLVPLYAVSLYGVSTLQSGLLLTPRSLALAVGSVFVSIFLVKWGYRWPLVVGTVVIAAACFLLGLELPGASILGVNITGPALIVVSMVLVGLGWGAVGPASSNSCIELMPDRISTLVGTRRMFMQAGSSVGIAVTSIVLARFDLLANGFQVILIAVAVVTLLGIPFIMGMPKSATDVPIHLRPPVAAGEKQTSL